MPKTPSIGLRLLRMIKRFPELYNSQHDLADDKAHSMVVWDTISYELDAPVSVLKKKWQRLRSSHRKRCRILKSTEAYDPLPRDDVFHLMYSMLDVSEEDSLSERDDSSASSAPTLSIISEEDRSTRSSSSSTLVAEIGASDRFHVDSSGLKNPAELIGGKNTSSRILGSSQPRATRSGPAGAAGDHRKDTHRSDSSLENFSIASSTLENRWESSARFDTIIRQNEAVRAFFKSMALTVAKFPRHIQATIKTKICNIVVEAELKLSPPEIR